MRCIAISLTFLLSTMTAAHAVHCGPKPTDICPCVGSGCKGRLCCVAYVDGKSYWTRADHIWPHRTDQMSPISYPLMPLALPVR